MIRNLLDNSDFFIKILTIENWDLKKIEKIKF